MKMIEENINIKDETCGALEINVLTLNVWGIPYISKNRLERLEGIVQQLCGDAQYDFVFLQEIWSEGDFTLVSEKVSSLLPHSHYFYNGLIGAGLCILSRHPITEVHFHPFSLNGFPHKIHHGDWFGGKGVGLCRSTVEGIPFILANTHFHAEYDFKGDQYIHHRVVQALETSQLLRFCSNSDEILIFSGDLNSCPQDVSFRLVKYNLDLVDTYLDCPHKPADSIGATNEIPSNSYTSVKSLRVDPNGKRIDHIFYRAPNKYKVCTKVCDHPWPPRVPQKSFSFSDHEAVHSTLLISSCRDGDCTDAACSDNVTAKTDALLDSSAVCTQGLQRISSAHTFYCILLVVLSLLQIIVIIIVSSEVDNSLKGFVSFLSIMVMPFLIYSVFMAFFWNRWERRSVLAAKSSMECLLKQMRIINARIYKEKEQRKALAK